MLLLLNFCKYPPLLLLKLFSELESLLYTSIVFIDSSFCKATEFLLLSLFELVLFKDNDWKFLVFDVWSFLLILRLKSSCLKLEDESS